MTNNFNVLVKTGSDEYSHNGWLWLNFKSDKQLSDQEVYQELIKMLRVCAKHELEQSFISQNEIHAFCPPVNGKYCSNCGTKMYTQEWLNEQIDEYTSRIIEDLMALDAVEIKQFYLDMLESHGWDLWGKPLNGKMIFISGIDKAIEGYPDYPEIESKKVTFK